MAYGTQKKSSFTGAASKMCIRDRRIVIIAGILIIAFVADYVCRKIIVPSIKKLTARTQATWDDYLFNDAVLDNMCHLIPPIISVSYTHLDVYKRQVLCLFG